MGQDEPSIIKLIEAVQADAIAQQQWMDIASAPRDGTPVLLVGQSKNALIPQVGFWQESTGSINGEYGQWHVDDGENCTVYLSEDIGDHPYTIYKPTHWMLLPSPPTHGDK